MVRQLCSVSTSEPYLGLFSYITMKATMTQDLLSGVCRINIRTCSEAINYMGEIYGFIRDTGLQCKMTTDFYRVSFTIRGYEEVAGQVPKIMQFISDVQNGRIKS